jgi:hypothetical protein
MVVAVGVAQQQFLKVLHFQMALVVQVEVAMVELEMRQHHFQLQIVRPQTVLQIRVVVEADHMQIKQQRLLVQVVLVLLSSKFLLYKTRLQSSLTQHHGMCQQA